MATYTVNKGDSESSINAVNQWLRVQPWYLQQLAQWGQNPARVKLSKSQSQQLLKLAQAHGAQIDEGAIEVDPGGNFNPKGHKLRNTLIAAGIGGAAALTGGAALGAFGGAGGLGAGAAAAPALGGGSTLAAGLGGAGALGAGGAGLAGAGAAAGAAGAAGAASHGIFSSLVAPALIKGAGAAVNGILANRAVGKATDQLTAASDRAQAINEQVYRENQGKYAPYIQGGTGAFGQLTAGLGLPAYQAPPQAAPPPQQGGGGMVTLQAPNGQTRQVPQAQAGHFVSLGAKILGGLPNVTPPMGSLPGDGTLAGRNNGPGMN